jgi:hypothetical protein
MPRVRWLLILFLACGPLALLQGVAWVSMALQTDLSGADSGDAVLAAFEEQLSTPCQLCRSVAATEDQQDEAISRNLRVELAVIEQPQLPATEDCLGDALVMLPPWHGVPQYQPQPRLPPPRA